MNTLNLLGKKITPFFLASVFIVSSVLLFNNAQTAPAAVNPPESPSGVSMYLPTMPACDGSFGTFDRLKTPFKGGYHLRVGFHWNNNPYSWHWGGAQITAGNDLDWYWIWLSSRNYGIWDLGKLTNKVRVYPSVTPPMFMERINSYTVSVSADGVSNWTELSPTATYINDIQNIKTHDGVKDFQHSTPFRYVKIQVTFGHISTIDAVQECSGTTTTPPPSQNELTVSCSASPNPTTTGTLVTFASQVTGGTGTYNYTWTGACAGFSNNCATIFGSTGTPTAFLTVTSGSQTKSTSCSVTVNPSGGTCLTDANCPSGQRCLNGTCIVPQCSANSDCPSGQICSGGRCIANPFPPTVETRPATDILANSATLRGILNSIGSDASASVWFQWGTSTAYGFETPHVTMTSASPFSAAISSLTPGSVYHFRAVAQNGQGTVYGQNMSFVAGNSVQAPQVQSLPPANVTPTSVLLNGQLLSLGGDNSAQVYFLWGPTVAYGNETAHQVMNTAGPFSQAVGGLTPGTVYHFKACAQNSAGTVCGSGMTFSTNNTQNPGTCTTNAQCGAGQTCVGGTCQNALSVTCNAMPNPASVGNAVTFNSIPVGGIGTYNYAWTGACTGFASSCSTTFGSAGAPVAFLTVTSGAQTASTSCAVTVQGGTTTGGGTVVCSSNAHCGTDGFVGGNYCLGNNVFRDFRTWTCNNPGTTSSSCSSSTTAQLQNYCSSNQTCSGGTCVTTTTGTQQGAVQVTKLGRNVSAGGFNWSSAITANPSDILHFQITVNNTGSQTLNNVLVTDNLPSQLYYQNVLTIDGAANSGNITTGVNIGNLNPGQTKTLVFQVQVAPSQNFNFGSTTLTNVVNITSSQANGSASSTVTVTKTGIFGATAVPTGLTNSLLKDSFFIPLLATVVIAWLFRSRIFNILDMAFALNRRYFTAEGRLARKIEAAKRSDNQ